MRAEPRSRERLPAAWAPGNRSWSWAFERAVQAVYVVVCALSAVDCVLLVRHQSVGGWALLPVVAGLFAVLASAVWLWRSGPSARIFWTCWLGFLGAQWWWLSTAAAAGGAGDWWAWQLSITLAGLLGATAAPRPLAGSLIVFSIGEVLVRPAALPDGRQLAAELLTCWQIALFAVLIVAAWRRIARAADTAAAQELRQAGVEAGVRAAEDMEQRAARSLHDLVLHALRAIVDGADGRADLARGMAAEAAAVFRTAPLRPPRNLAGARSALQGLIGSSEVSVTVVGSDAQLPPEALDAVLTATGEALRNVQRHAGVGAAKIHISALAGDGVAVRILDRGRGFDYRAVHSSARGLSHSMVAVMSAVGGTATVDSRPGLGTTVLLEWRPAPVDAVESRVTSADVMVEWAGARRALLVGCILPETLGGTLHSALWTSTLGAPLVGALAVLVGVCAVVACARRVWTGGSFTTAQSIVICVIGCGCIGLGGIALDHASADGMELRVVGVVAPLFMMLAWRASRTVAVLGAAAAAAVAATAAASTPVGVAGLFPMVTLCPLTVAMVLVMRRIVAGAGVRVQAALTAEGAAIAAAQDARVRQTARAARLDRLGPSVLPLLDAVVDGSADLRDPAVAAAAAELSAAVRDDLCLGQELSGRSRALLAAARGGGCRIDVHGDDGAFPGIGPSVETLLEMGLGRGFRPESAVLTVQRDGGGTPVASLLTRPELPLQHDSRPSATRSAGPGTTSGAPAVPTQRPATDSGFTLLRVPMGSRDVISAGSAPA